MDYLMFILVYVAGYAIFMLLAYVLAKVIFTRIETKEEKERLTQLELIKAKRVRVKRQRLAHVHNKKVGHHLLPA